MEGWAWPEGGAAGPFWESPLGSDGPRGCRPHFFPASPSALGKQHCLSNSWAQQWHAATVVFALMFLPFSDSNSVPGVRMAGQPPLLMQHSICQPVVPAVHQVSEAAQWMVQSAIQTPPTHTFLRMQSKLGGMRKNKQTLKAELNSPLDLSTNHCSDCAFSLFRKGWAEL